MTNENNKALLKVDGLVKHFPITRGIFRREVGSVNAVDGISFEIQERETLGLVGESGCGKSTAARVILQLIPATAGNVFFKGRDLTSLDKEELRKQRQHMQMIFQDPQDSLNPRMTVGSIISEPLMEHKKLQAEERSQRVEQLLISVGMNPKFTNRYPHEFSGGQRQRIGIARALALSPEFIICDEPIAALDVSIQAQVINLLEDLQEEFGLTYLFISHDLSMIRHIADRVAVMYLGRIVELASSQALYSTPLHPYTQALLSALFIPTHRLCFQQFQSTIQNWKGNARALSWLGRYLARLIRHRVVTSVHAVPGLRIAVSRILRNGEKFLRGIRLLAI